MTTQVLESVVAGRASAYDRVYEHWHAKRVTIESFESWARYFLHVPADEPGHLNGNEIEFALQLLGVHDLRGKTVLDLCCGAGRTSIYLALKGARVRACDASAQAIDIARESVRLSQVEDRVEFEVMDAQELDYPDESFDAIYCQSALHILVDYPRCAAELARVLRPDGRVVFCEEALGHNWLLEPVRRWRRRKYSECGGRPLRYSDLHAFGGPFGWMRVHHFNLLTQVKSFLGESARRPWVKAVLRRLEAIDRRLLKAVPRLERYCGKIVVEFRAPKR